jgi:hypothetical protein
MSKTATEIKNNSSYHHGNLRQTLLLAATQMIAEMVSSRFHFENLPIK